jgi:hypothetical protein
MNLKILGSGLFRQHQYYDNLKVLNIIPLTFRSLIDNLKKYLIHIY